MRTYIRIREAKVIAWKLSVENNQVAVIKGDHAPFSGNDESIFL